MGCAPSRGAGGLEGEKEADRLRLAAAPPAPAARGGFGGTTTSSGGGTGGALAATTRTPQKKEDERAMLFTRANTTHYLRVHEAAMAEIFRSGNGTVGLRNLGNTCFMNATIQSLCHSVSLADYFLGYEWEHEINQVNPLGWRGEMASAFGELLEKMWSTPAHVAIAPRRFKSATSKCAPQFAGHEQHDAHEFLTFLLDALHEDLNRCRDAKKPYVADVECDGTDQDRKAAEAWRGYLRRDRSIVVDLFQGQLRSTVKCDECGAEQIRFDPFMYLSVPIVGREKSGDHVHDDDDDVVVARLRGGRAVALEKTIENGRRKATLDDDDETDNGETDDDDDDVNGFDDSWKRRGSRRRRRRRSPPQQQQQKQRRRPILDLEQCVEDFAATERLDGDDSWRCPSCEKSVAATKRIELWKLPPVVIVHLKRFEQHAFSYRKLETYVDFPLADLDLSAFCKSPQRDAPVYDAYAVVNHHGDVASGHYTAFAKNRLDGEWRLYNDARVSTVRDPDTHVKTRDAYVLFYSRVVLNAGPRDAASSSSSHGSGGRRRARAPPEASSVASETMRPTSGSSHSSSSSNHRAAHSKGTGSTDGDHAGRAPVVRRQSISLPHLWPHYAADGNNSGRPVPGSAADAANDENNLASVATVALKRTPPAAGEAGPPVVSRGAAQVKNTPEPDSAVVSAGGARRRAPRPPSRGRSARQTPAKKMKKSAAPSSRLAEPRAETTAAPTAHRAQAPDADDRPGGATKKNKPPKPPPPSRRTRKARSL